MNTFLYDSHTIDEGHSSSLLIICRLGAISNSDKDALSLIQKDVSNMYGLRYAIEKYLVNFNFIDEDNSLTIVRELLDSNDKDNLIIASEILIKLKYK